MESYNWKNNFNLIYFPILFSFGLCFEPYDGIFNSCTENVDFRIVESGAIDKEKYSEWLNDFSGGGQATNYYYIGSSAEGNYLNPEAQQLALQDLIKKVSTNIESQTTKFFEQTSSNTEEKYSTIVRHNLSSWSNIKEISNYKTVIVDAGNGKISAHVFKCKQELDADIKVYDQNQFNLYKDSFSDFETSSNLNTKFKSLCKSYFYLNSFIKKENSEEIKTILEEFEILKRIHLKYPKKPIDIIPFLSQSKKIIIDSDYKAEPLSYFDFDVQFKDGSGLNNWSLHPITNEIKHVFTSDMNGKLEVDFGIILSRSEEQVLAILPSISSVLNELTAAGLTISSQAYNRLKGVIDNHFTTSSEIKLNVRSKIPIKLEVEMKENKDISNNDMKKSLHSLLREAPDFDFDKCDDSDCDFFGTMKFKIIEIISSDDDQYSKKITSRSYLQIGDKEFDYPLTFSYYTASGSSSAIKTRDVISDLLSNISNDLYMAKAIYGPLTNKEKLILGDRTLLGPIEYGELYIPKAKTSLQYYYSDDFQQDTTFYISSRLDLNDLYNRFEEKEIKYNFRIVTDKEGLIDIKNLGVRWNDGKVKKVLGNNIRSDSYNCSFSGRNSESHEISIYKSGYLIPDSYIDDSIEKTSKHTMKIKRGGFKSEYKEIRLSRVKHNRFLSYLLPGTFQTKHYKLHADPFLYSSGWLYHVFHFFLVYQLYDNYSGYKKSLESYENYKNDYENIPSGASSQTYDEKLDRVSLAYEDLMNYRESFYQESLVPMILFYGVNFLHVNIEFGR